MLRKIIGGKGRMNSKRSIFFKIIILIIMIKKPSREINIIKTCSGPSNIQHQEGPHCTLRTLDDYDTSVYDRPCTEICDAHE